MPFGMILELIATFCTAIFAGAAIYINLVEHPARLECGTAAAVREWRPSYRRATLMQASLALAAVLGSLGAWVLGRGLPVLLAGACIGSVIPFTLIVIYPTNRQLEDPKARRRESIDGDPALAVESSPCGAQRRGDRRPRDSASSPRPARVRAAANSLNVSTGAHRR